ncbi:MAG: trypsin-like peptidase domain-containing protein [Lachnospiraceae bacterium]|nr:trypsin-like peptidase domain-containing protein [Lachnospiraceae bacterium]
MKKWLGAIIAACAVVFTVLMLIFAYPRNSMPSDYTKAKNGVVFIYSDFQSFAGTGSGFAIGENGKPVQYIVTNYHVVFDTDTGEKANEVIVYFSAAANRYMVAQIYRYDADRDIAVLRLPEPTNEVEPLKLCKSEDTDRSQTFYALGYPARATAGTDYERYDKSEIVTTSGMISRQTMVDERDVYMLDLEITPGNSGGPLVNKNGEVVGINTFSITDSSGARSNYAVCIDELLRVIGSYEIPYVLSTDVNTGGIIVLAVIVLVDLAAAVFVLLSLTGKKKPADGRRSMPNSPVRERASADTEINRTVAVNDITSTVAVSGGLVVITGIAGSCEGKEYILKDKLVFGRDSKRCNVVFPLDAEGVSGLHCQISRAGSGVKLQDLGSTYGTFVSGGLKVGQNTEVELSDGDTFWLGSEKMKFSVSIR